MDIVTDNSKAYQNESILKESISRAASIIRIAFTTNANRPNVIIVIGNAITCINVPIVKPNNAITTATNSALQIESTWMPGINFDNNHIVKTVNRNFFISIFYLFICKYNQIENS